MAEDCWPMKLALGLLPVAADVLTRGDTLDELDAVESAFVLSLRGAAERLFAELRTTESEPCLFRRGSWRLSMLDDLDEASGRCPGDTV